MQLVQGQMSLEELKKQTGGLQDVQPVLVFLDTIRSYQFQELGYCLALVLCSPIEVAFIHYSLKALCLQFHELSVFVLALSELPQIRDLQAQLGTVLLVNLDDGDIDLTKIHDFD